MYIYGTLHEFCICFQAAKSNYKLSHIEEIDTQHRLVGSKGLRIKVYENGTYDESVILFFNLTQATRGIGHDQKKLMERVSHALSIVDISVRL
jgi:hypothetical protein